MSIVVSIPVDIHPIHHPSLLLIVVSRNPVVIILFYHDWKKKTIKKSIQSIPLTIKCLIVSLIHTSCFRYIILSVWFQIINVVFLRISTVPFRTWKRMKIIVNLSTTQLNHQSEFPLQPNRSPNIIELHFPISFRTFPWF